MVILKAAFIPQVQLYRCSGCVRTVECYWREFITAIVGYEATNRISEAIHPGHLSKFQPTGTVGAIDLPSQ